MFASLFLAGRASRLCVAIFNANGAIRTPCLGLIGARLTCSNRARFGTRDIPLSSC